MPTPWATLPLLFCDGFFWDRVSRTICPSWLGTVILLLWGWPQRLDPLASASWVNPTSSLNYLFILKVLGYEFRALYSLGGHSITSAMPPTLFCYSYFFRWGWSHSFSLACFFANVFLGWPRTDILSISASLVTGITVRHHHAWPLKFLIFIWFKFSDIPFLSCVSGNNNIYLTGLFWYVS
jgi:hypothetical protein